MLGRVYFSVQLITICAVVNLKCAAEKATCAVVKCAVVKYLPKSVNLFPVVSHKTFIFLSEMTANSIDTS